MTEVVAPQGVLLLVDIDLVVPNPDNPRRVVTADQQMVDSIKTHGLIHPPTVRPVTVDGNDVWEILGGHRRVDGAVKAGLTEIPVVVRDDVGDEQALEIMLVENLSRVELAPLEEAAGYQALADLGLSQREIADKVGVSQGQVSKRVGLLKLPANAQALVDSGGITVEQAAQLGKLPADKAEELCADGAPNGWRLEAAVEEAERARKVKKLLADLKKAGTIVLDVDPWKLADGMRLLSNMPWVDETKHEIKACHAVIVPTRGPVAAMAVCTDAKKHPAPKPKPEPADGETNAGRAEPDWKAAQAEREAERALHVEAKERRVEFCKHLVARDDLDIGRIVGLAAPALAWTCDYEPGSAMALLGEEPAQDWDERRTQFELIAVDRPLAALHAFALDLYEDLIHPYSGALEGEEMAVVGVYLAWLEANGFEPGDVEKALNDQILARALGQVEDAGVDAAEALADLEEAADDAAGDGPVDEQVEEGQ